MFSKSINIKTLTPVFIGSGEVIGSFEYLIHNNKLFRLNLNSCFKFIFNKRNDAFDLLNKWSEEKSSQLTFNSNRARSDLNMSIFDFIKDKNYLSDSKLYDELIKEIESGKHIYYAIKSTSDTRSRDITALLKTANNQIYLPGSSIKGMIRTALLMDALERKLEDSDFKKMFISKLRNSLSGNPNKNNIGEFVEQEIFYAGNTTKNGITYRDEKFDLMKFIHISDSNALDLSNYAILTKTQLLTFNKNEVQGQSPFIEAIAKDIEFNCRITIDIEYIKTVYQSKKSNEWIEFDKKINTLFNLSITNLINKTDQEFGDVIFKKIEESLSHQSDLIYNNEIQWLENSEMKRTMSSKRIYDKFISNLRDDKIILKLGQGMSFVNNTIIKIINDIDPDLSLKILNNRNLGIIRKGQLKDINEFPKSRKLSGNYNSIIGLGWIELIFGDN